MEGNYLLHTSVFTIVAVLLTIVTWSRNKNISSLDKVKIVTMDHRGNAMLAGMMLISTFMLGLDAYFIIDMAQDRPEFTMETFFLAKVNTGNYPTYLIGEFMLLGATIYASVTEIKIGKLIANE